MQYITWFATGEVAPRAYSQALGGVVPRGLSQVDRLGKIFFSSFQPIPPNTISTPSLASILLSMIHISQ